MSDDPKQSDIVLYTTDDGRSRVLVRVEGGTVWLTQAQLAELFQVSVPTINEHLRNIFAEDEATEAATIRNFLIVRSEGTRTVQREIAHYNLDVILAIGYRVRSLRGTQFRQWATERLREYLVKGFTMDDERLANGTLPDEYFDELLERIRAIRASERRFYQKITDIYTTSIDYQGDAKQAQLFFKTVQTNSTGPSRDTPPRRSSPNAPTPANPAWASPPGAANAPARATSPWPRTTSTKRNSPSSTASSPCTSTTQRTRRNAAAP